jgi:cytochrome c556
MNRKWTVLSATMVAVALSVTGLSFADDEDSPLHKLMEKVNKANLAITKAVRTPPAYKKAQKEIVTNAEELGKLGKEARGMTDAAKKTKGVDKPEEKWTTLMDEFIKSTDEFAKEAGKSDATQVQVKAAYKNVSKKCANCHDVFRVEE